MCWVNSFQMNRMSLKIAAGLLIATGCTWFLQTMRVVFREIHTGNLPYEFPHAISELMPSFALVMGSILIWKHKRGGRFLVGVSTIVYTFLNVLSLAFILQQRIFRPNWILIAVLLTVTLLVDAAAFIVIVGSKTDSVPTL